MSDVDDEVVTKRKLADVEKLEIATEKINDIKTQLCEVKSNYEMEISKLKDKISILKDGIFYFVRCDIKVKI